MKTEAVILAAGLGTRMNSDLPKVLHLLGDRIMIDWIVTACREATNKKPYIVVGPEMEAVKQAVGSEARFITQNERLGTGHAVLQAIDQLQGRSDQVLVVNADLPLLRSETLKRLIDQQESNSGPLSIVTAFSEVSRGFGRINRDSDGVVTGIIEEAHATSKQLTLHELNVGAYCYQADWLWEHLPILPLSPKGEYYLTDLVEIASTQGLEVADTQVEDLDEVIGINTR
jgi:bifunctional UDP-N-acetylglucosamine pyrophosphorylase/glucosamine-1-phosphate N-acetyltransferase